MPSASDTAYPRFKINPMAKELNELYTPTVRLGYNTASQLGQLPRELRDDKREQSVNRRPSRKQPLSTN
jgi:hypothetical protein